MTMPTYIDGVIQPTTRGPAVLNVSSSTAAPNPEALLGRHSWGSNAAYPGPWTPGAVHAKTDAGAVGDGIADDAKALQKAVDLAANGSGVVFMPRGTYRVSRTIHVPAGVTVAGIARQYVTIVANNSMFEGPGAGVPPAMDTEAPPVLLFGGRSETRLNGEGVSDRDGMPGARPGSSPVSAVFGLQVVIPLSTVNVSAVQWSLGMDGSSAVGPAPLDRKKESIGVLASSHWVEPQEASWSASPTSGLAYGNARQVWTTNVPTCGSWLYNERCSRIFFEAAGYAHALVVVTSIGGESGTGGIDELRWHTWY